MKPANCPGSSGTSFSRRSFLKTLATATLAAPFVTSGLMAQSPNSVLRHASFGASGMAGEDLNELTKCKALKLVAVAEVDLNRAVKLKERFPEVKVYQDWRKMLDEQAKNIDSVNVSTPDHMHAAMAMSALRLGKHVYCQKPLTHDLYEVRTLTEYARKHKVVTQMGIQIHSLACYRMVPQLVQCGAIGKVKEIHSWCTRGWGDPNPLPESTDGIPEGFDWDLWLGVCEQRPFIGKGYYHPANWRKRLDFGTGSLGDMGCHIFDPVFSALKLTAPISVRSEGAAPNKWNWALDGEIHYVFPGNAYTAADTVPLTWYHGGPRPPAEVKALLEGDPFPETGSIVVGTEGTLVIPHIARPLLYPDKKFHDFKYPDVAAINHWAEFVDACGGKGKTSTHFDYSGPLTEAVLLGTVATRFPKTTLSWNAAKLKFSEAAANQFIRRKYRHGWSVKGLA
jgi:predicted dehydrogenase